MENNRIAGVLLPIFSLPGKYGIGDFGKDAYLFVDKLKDANVKIWQILPLNPLGFGNSPYQPLSSNAGDEIFIDLDFLEEMNLISNLPESIISSKIDYETVRDTKQKILKEAFTNFEPSNEYEDFIKENEWVIDYANFISRTKNDGFWQEWEERNDFSQKYPEEMKYEMFVQYIFYKQWMKLKNYANENGIQIMGDIPIYVGLNSVDVWINKDNFILDENDQPIVVSGVAPDYFSEEGQRWGNPIYDYESMKKDNYKFFINRLADNVKMYDIIRIDHFRALDTYYSIEAKYENAKIGNWVEAPGYEILDQLFLQHPDIKIVVEDLGDLRPEVHKLRDHYNLAGMKIVQFTFDPNENNNNFEDRENMLIYTGTHDNQTIMGWYIDQSRLTKFKIKKFFKKKGYKGSIHEKFMQYTLESIANLAILPIQDIIGLNDKYRINTPGTVGTPNWEFKLKDIDQVKLDVMKELIIRTNRA